MIVVADINVFTRLLTSSKSAIEEDAKTQLKNVTQIVTLVNLNHTILYSIVSISEINQNKRQRN